MALRGVSVHKIVYLGCSNCYWYTTNTRVGARTNVVIKKSYKDEKNKNFSLEDTPPLSNRAC